MRKLIECVPNISEGRRPEVIDAIANTVKQVDGVRLLDVDPGKATNRTVITFVGEPDQVVEAAYKLISKAAELIDMSQHSGEHPRFGATDVCPFIPVANASMQDCVECARKLGERVGKDLDVPVYLYESAATEEKRKNLATVRAGEYEGIEEKIKQEGWKPDFGPQRFNEKTGNIAIGARDFLIAFNVNLNTTSVRRANSVAFDIREKGRIKTEDGTPTGKKVLDKDGNPERVPGSCPGVKGIGWYIEEYGVAQISMNITDVNKTPLHKAFDETVHSAHRRGMRVTGSELVGLVPLQSMLDAGKYFLQKQNRSIGVSEEELVRVAALSMGLSDLKPFVPEENIIEWMIRETSSSKLVGMDLKAFAHETASESPAPGGGSISAYVGTLGVALGTMVANLSSHKRGWDDRWDFFSQWADNGQQILSKLLRLVDEDTAAFERIMAAIRLPKGSPEEKAARQQAMKEATEYAIEVPLEVMRTAYSMFDLLDAMAKDGNPNSASDTGVGALCARTAIQGAGMNVRINIQDVANGPWKTKVLEEMKQLEKDAERRCNAIVDRVESLIA